MTHPDDDSNPVSFPYTGILDNFNRANNDDIGANWSGSKSSSGWGSGVLDVFYHPGQRQQLRCCLGV